MLQLIREPLVRRWLLRLGAVVRVHDVGVPAPARVEVAVDRGPQGRLGDDLFVGARGGGGFFVGYVCCACFGGGEKGKKLALRCGILGYLGI